MPASLYTNIPVELRLLKQWVLWKYEDIGAAKPTKVPYSIKGHPASVTDANHWATFDDAFNVLNLGSYNGLGFVFTKDDPYIFIDLDDAEGDDAILQRHLKVYHEFETYAEVSPSGKGLHLICKGNVPAGRRRSKIEIYPHERYATMTGNVYSGRNTIVDCQPQLQQLWEQMGSGPVAQSMYQGDDKENDADEIIIERARNAINGDKFIRLHKGEWQDFYNSQSEADFAYVDIIAFYTQNRLQIQRIFRSSALGARDKAKRSDYVNGMINRSFDRMLPPLDFDGLKNAIDLKLAVSNNGSSTAFDAASVGSNPSAATNNNRATKLNGSVAQLVEPTAHNSISVGSSPATPTTPPPGLLGEIAQFIYAAAPRPVPEIALAGAIGLMAGICGKAYNISGTGLNQYILLIADSGKGKEAMASGISKLVSNARLQVPVANDFIGPSSIASSPGLHKFLSKNSQCFVSILGEFGIKLEAMSNHKASPVQLLLKDCILDLYHKSGYNDVYRGSAYSDQEKNSSDISAPAFSILGESTPERFYTILTEEMINEGLLPRFSVIEYTGIRVPSNEYPIIAPAFSLVESVCALMAHVKTIMGANKVINVGQSDEALRFTKWIDTYADKQINSAAKEVTRQLWNRAHIKTLKLSATLAVGVNPYNPVIELSHAEWAWELVQKDIRSLASKFEQGLIGANSDEIRQVEEMKRVMRLYLKEPWEKIQTYAHIKALHDNKVIPYAYLNKRLTSVAVFKNDRLGATASIKRCLQNMVDNDDIKELGKIYTHERFGTSQRVFVLSNLKILD